MRRTVVLSVFLIAASGLHAETWLRFRGTNGVGAASHGTVEKPSLTDNLLWKTPLPPGHSSPIVTADKVFVTAIDDEKLFTIALDRESGKVLWRRQAPRPRREEMHEQNSPAAGTPASDGENVYVFFGDFGLLSYGADGGERWRVPLGPFTNIRGMAASPILVDGKLILALDDDSDHSKLLALDPSTGKEIWRVDRSGYRKSFSIPAVHRPADGPAQLIVPGSFSMTSYSVETGEEIWRAGGFCWQPKAVPMIDETHAYLNCQGARADPDADSYPLFPAAVEQFDSDGDGGISEAEFYEKKRRIFFEYDFSENGKLEEDEWEFFRNRMATRPGVFAVRLGGSGDVSETHVDWVVDRPMGNVPSPLLHDGVIYSIRNAGILSSIDAKTGEIIKQGRVPEALAAYYASPIVADGKIYLLDLDGTLSVVKAQPQWEVVHTLALGEGGNATPAISDGRLFVRTNENLYCFGR